MLVRPSEHTERSLITAILNGEYSAGATLPAERELALELGVTRPTLRETQQRLAREGWLTIRHGKATVVNDIWRQGGLGLLRTMAQYGEYLPEGFVVQLLEFRALMLPACARKAAANQPESLLEYLAAAPGVGAGSGAFAGYDWELQLKLTRDSGNLIYPLIFNDFAPMYAALARRYFDGVEGREASSAFYAELAAAVARPEEVERVVRAAMERSAVVWSALSDGAGDEGNGDEVRGDRQEL
jgi:GntR family negative regulator for fad regulon and positive regulator of fabA